MQETLIGIMFLSVDTQTFPNLHLVVKPLLIPFTFTNYGVKNSQTLNITLTILNYFEFLNNGITVLLFHNKLCFTRLQCF